LQQRCLDRLLYKCEVIKLTGKSYRLEHRKTIFNQLQPVEGGPSLGKKQLPSQKVVANHFEMTSSQASPWVIANFRNWLIFNFRLQLLQQWYNSLDAA
jgi:hypothetical protein